MKSYLIPFAAVVLCLSFPSTLFADSSGRVTSARCPHSCKSLGIPKSQCRDWRRGNRCYVEDLRPTSRHEVRRPRNARHWRYPWTPNNYDNHYTSYPHYPDRFSCSRASRHELERPRIRIDDIDRVGWFSDRIEVEGEISGRCIREAAYYENGRKVRSLDTKTRDSFGTFEFDFRADPDRRPEIRAYNTAGELTVYRLSERRDCDDDRRYDDPYYGTDYRYPNDWRYFRQPATYRPTAADIVQGLLNSK